MKNLNKFTKAELINKFRKIENHNKSILNKIFSYIILYKNTLLKLTLIGLIIRWIKKYSLIRKLWHLISTIASTLLGISFIDIYGIDLISWIRETQIYKWFYELFNTPKVIDNDSSNEGIPSFMEKINPNTTRNESDHRIIKRFKEIISKEPEVINNEELDKTNYKYIFIIGSLFISGAIVYYYWDDLKKGGTSAIEWIKSFRSGFDDNSSSNIQNNTGNNQLNIQTNLNTRERLVRERIIERDIESNIDSSSDIQLIDNNQPPIYSQSSTILTSPSLENLNEQAQDSWGEGSSQISSPDSDRTITQASTSQAVNLISSNWKGKLTSIVNDKINFIESCFGSENNLTLESGLKLSDYYAYIINEYNTEIETYNFMKSSSNFNDIETLNSMKESIYYFREWIAEYHTKIFPNSTVTIEIGTIHDSPKILTKNIA